MNPDKPTLLIELKYDKSVKAASDQITDKRYAQKLEHYKDNLLIVAINYDKDIPITDMDYKHHSCVIRKFETMV